MSEERTIWVMPKDWVMNFVAAWRVFERTLNPAFYFLLQCGKCKLINKQIRVVKSVKTNELIGMECTNCGQTIKFGRKIGLDSEDFPTRLAPVPDSVLIDPDGEVAEADPKADLSLLTKLVFDA